MIRKLICRGDAFREARTDPRSEARARPFPGMLPARGYACLGTG